MDSASVHGLMVDNTEDIGKITKDTASENINNLKIYTKVILSLTRSLDMVNTFMKPDYILVI